MNTTYKHQNTENHFLLLYPFQKEPNQNCQTMDTCFLSIIKVLMYSLSQLVCSKHLLFAYYSLRNSVSVKHWLWCFNHANEYITMIPLFSNPNHLILIPLTLTNAPFCGIETKNRDIGNLSYFAFKILLTCTDVGVVNGTSKNVGLGKFWQDLEISEAFLTSLKVSFLPGLSDSKLF